MIIENEEFEQVKRGRKPKNKTVKKTVNSKNAQLLSILESLENEKLLLNKSKNTYDYDYLLIYFKDFCEELNERFNECVLKRFDELNADNIGAKEWTAEVKEIAKIRKVFLRNLLTN